MFNQIQEKPQRLAATRGVANIKLTGDPQVLDRNQLVQELLQNVNRLNTEAGGSTLTIDKIDEVDKGTGLRVIFRGDVRHPNLILQDN